MVENPKGKVLVRAPKMAGSLLRGLVEFAIDGSTAFPGAKTTAVKALQQRGDRELAIESVINSHIGLASAQGFLTSVGGLLTLPVGLPANIAGLGVLGVRMLASVAHLRGHDVDDRRVRTAITLAMLGEDEVRRLIEAGRIPATPLAIATSPVFDAALDQLINERVMGSLAGRLGGKHLAVVVVRRIPLVGGGVGAVVDGWLTLGLGAYAKREFVARHQISIPRQ